MLTVCVQFYKQMVTWIKIINEGINEGIIKMDKKINV